MEMQMVFDALQWPQCIQQVKFESRPRSGLISIIYYLAADLLAGLCVYGLRGGVILSFSVFVARCLSHLIVKELEPYFDTNDKEQVCKFKRIGVILHLAFILFAYLGSALLIGPMGLRQSFEFGFGSGVFGLLFQTLDPARHFCGA